MNIILTGATGKIGSRLALCLGKEHNLILQYYSNDRKAAELKKQLNRYGAKTEILKWDLIRDYKNFIAETEKIFPCHALINSFSTFKENTFGSFAEEDFDSDIKSNVLSPLVIIKEFAKKHPKGCAVNFLDTKSMTRDEKHFTYSVSEYLYRKITEECAYYLTPFRVNGIALGLNETDPFGDPGRLPIKEKVTVNDICQSVLYLINSPHITGEIIYLDSGRHIRY